MSAGYKEWLEGWSVVPIDLGTLTDNAVTCEGQTIFPHVWPDEPFTYEPLRSSATWMSHIVHGLEKPVKSPKTKRHNGPL
jgi:hypothetical protein